MNTMTRKQFGRIALAAGLALGMGTVASAQDGYPNKPITMVVPASAGGTTDLAARMTAQALGPVLGQTLVVENKGGGNGNIAAAQVKRAEADGYTLLMQYSGFHVISPHLGKSSWELKDFVPVANVLSAPQIVVVRGDLPVNTMQELVAYAKANPMKLNYASSGNGSLQHVTGVQLERAAGVQMMHVPYKGTGPALQDLLGGQVDLTFGTAPPFMPHIQAGKLKVLAVTGKERLPSLPDVPTTAETGFPGVNATSWFAMFAPAGTPAAIVSKLESDVRNALAEPAFQQKARDQGAAADFMDSKALGDMVQRDWDMWAQIVKEANIKGD
ncbi:Bug family tripartite tricarboxylate transporter substrate binding protein [Comamonas kerstersii]|jgi:tripartite-type tricarboxylate transporter receptor subunit TctC|uniref:Tripartite tricarboxylate transporter substrate binding protein n=1 Tax=Comamonas kerstersii TaxID=225992 RepID=A0A6A1R461_9BURK|nr:tripartite tricarboxylate transporter substrate binding protein [Comamonas kerstersii]MDO4969701.1 tripartite tricarboxylate transporter substrate binding protein [Comamonadaceae bacterium]KAB0587413.1 tripartite tricarboxylate transporter substrate binding protein [Comamonas kerstersii]OOH88661.1 ABC transporter substrate-binding protein [Comamonas kerstersii]OOH94883.1 ABC transporter substrate-binding protein [Comamonas kerstersii]QTW18133.1 tripartite tricarboxylate transporter substrat